MNSMTKLIPVRKNTTGNCEQDAKEESSASEGETETVGKSTGKTPDTQNVQDVTETVTEKRTMEEIPLSTQEQVLQCLSTERCEVTVLEPVKTLVLRYNTSVSNLCSEVKTCEHIKLLL